MRRSPSGRRAPTRGLDIRATAAVQDRLRTRSRRVWAAVVIYSSDLDEVIALASRVFVLHAGIVRENTPRPRPGGLGNARARLEAPRAIAVCLGRQFPSGLIEDAIPGNFPGS